MLENPYASSDPPETCIRDDIEVAYDEIHRAIRVFNGKYNMSPEAHLEIVNIGQLVTDHISKIRGKAAYLTMNDAPIT